MKIAILTFEGFNEIDSFVAFNILNKMRSYSWEVKITSPTPNVTSMNGVTIEAQETLPYANSSDVVLFGSGIYTRDIAKNNSILDQLKLNQNKQLIGAQCSGTLLLAKLGLLKGLPACTDQKTKSWVVEAGVEVLKQPFFASNNIATAGGCLSSTYLTTWVIAKLAGKKAAETALSYVAPVGETKKHNALCLSVVEPYITEV